VLSGIPLYRLAYFPGTLHPEFAGKGYFCDATCGIEVAGSPHGHRSGKDFLDNPLPPVFEQRKTIRCPPREYRAAGAPSCASSRMTARPDYVALPSSSRPAR